MPYLAQPFHLILSKSGSERLNAFLRVTKLGSKRSRITAQHPRFPFHILPSYYIIAMTGTSPARTPLLLVGSSFILLITSVLYTQYFCEFLRACLKFRGRPILVCHKTGTYLISMLCYYDLIFTQLL